jgi:hypothetical protein
VCSTGSRFDSSARCLVWSTATRERPDAMTLNEQAAGGRIGRRTRDTRYAPVDPHFPLNHCRLRGSPAFPQRLPHPRPSLVLRHSQHTCGMTSSASSTQNNHGWHTGSVSRSYIKTIHVFAFFFSAKPACPRLCKPHARNLESASPDTSPCSPL